MNNLAVKICGITNHEDASSAVGLGATALGFIFAPSPRQVEPDKVQDIVRMLPPFVKTVGVFVNEEHAAIEEIKQHCGLDLVQLHGDESPDFCGALMPRAIKAIRVKDPSSLDIIKAFQGKARAVLLDTYAKSKPGGTGRTFDWELTRKAKAYGMPVILAGGLGPSNIVDAIRMVRPCAVDINSGIEEHPGKKSYVLMKRLMDKLRQRNLL
jgi:phosphoribosylanthranilate isomerase